MCLKTLVLHLYRLFVATYAMAARKGMVMNVVKGIRFLEVSFTECNLASFNEGFFPLGRSYRTE